MEKLDKVIRALENCTGSGCMGCEYADVTGGFDECMCAIMKDALAVIKDLQEKLKMAKDGRLELARQYRERSSGDLISRSALLAELSNKLTIVELLGVAEIVGGIPTVEAEPVVHAHWERFKHPSGTHGIRCSQCKTVNGRNSKYCPECGAAMDEKVFEPTPIGKLLFSMRVYKRLKQAGITTMEQLESTDKRTLHSIPGLGKQSILEIEEKLKEWKETNNELLER